MADDTPSEPDEEQIAVVVPLRGNLPTGSPDDDDSTFSTLVPAEPDGEAEES